MTKLGKCKRINLSFVQTGMRLVLIFLFLLGTHAAKWVQHPLKNQTHAPYLRLVARQSERGFTKPQGNPEYGFVHDQLQNQKRCTLVR